MKVFNLSYILIITRFGHLNSDGFNHIDRAPYLSTLSRQCMYNKLQILEHTTTSDPVWVNTSIVTNVNATTQTRLVLSEYGQKYPLCIHNMIKKSIREGHEKGKFINLTCSRKISTVSKHHDDDHNNKKD